MRFTITGATGFIGSRLVARLLEDGHYVNILGRTRKPGIESRAAWAAWNSVAETPPPETISKTDVIIHLAGEPVAQRWTDDVKRRIRESRVLGTRNLTRGIETAKYPPKVLVSASAVGYYGDRGDEVLTEASPPGTGFLPEVCVEWEREAQKALTLGLRVVSIRIGIVLGRGGGALEKMLTPFRAGVGGRLGSGQQWMPWIHVDDLVRLFVYCGTEGALSGAVNGTAPNPVRNAEFTDALASVLHRPALMPVPRFGLKLVMGEMAEIALQSQRAVPAAASGAGFEFRFSDVKSSLADLLR